MNESIRCPNMGIGGNMSGIASTNTINSIYQSLYGTNSNLLNTVSSIGGNSSEESDSDAFGTAETSQFSSILETYLNTQKTQNTQMAEKLSQVLKTASASEDSSSATYQTVQELYQYFLKQAGNSADSVDSYRGNVVSSSTSSAGQESTSTISSSEMDFDALESNLQSNMEEKMESTGISM
jgi:hypothetical protein